MEYEEKFIVININRFKELNQKRNTYEHSAVRKLKDALNIFYSICDSNNIKVDHKYYVVNQDEPYANEIIKLILEGEENKT